MVIVLTGAYLLISANQHLISWCTKFREYQLYLLVILYSFWWSDLCSMYSEQSQVKRHFIEQFYCQVSNGVPYCFVHCFISTIHHHSRSPTLSDPVGYRHTAGKKRARSIPRSPFLMPAPAKAARAGRWFRTNGFNSILFSPINCIFVSSPLSIPVIVFIHQIIYQLGLVCSWNNNVISSLGNFKYIIEHSECIHSVCTIEKWTNPERTVEQHMYTHYLYAFFNENYVNIRKDFSSYIIIFSFNW